MRTGAVPRRCVPYSGVPRLTRRTLGPTFNYISRLRNEEALLACNREVALKRVRYGNWRIYTLLRSERTITTGFIVSTSAKDLVLQLHLRMNLTGNIPLWTLKAVSAQQAGAVVVLKIEVRRHLQL